MYYTFIQKIIPLDAASKPAPLKLLIKSLAKPSNFLARIGTPMKQLIEACGGLPEDTGKIIGGGPMMGKALVNTDVPTAKGSSGILIMNEKEAKRGEVQPCIRCAKYFPELSLQI